MARLTGELALAAERRGAAFRAKMPTILGFYDDGDDRGRVEVLGAGAAEGTARTRIPGTRDVFEVPCERVTISDETAEHLDVALGYLRQWEWMQRNPRMGRRAHVCNPALR